MFSSLILLPVIGVMVLNLPLGAFMKKAAFWLCLFIVSVQLCVVVFPALCFWSNWLDILGVFLKFNFSVDNLSRVLLFCIGMVVFAAVFVQRYLDGEKEKFFNFVNLLLLLLIGMNGIVMVRDIFSMYVFVEIAAVSSFILICFDKDFAAFEGAFKYIVLSAVATVLMLSAIALLLVVSGDTGFSSLSVALKASPNRMFINLAIGIFITACLIKSGLMPFHGWLPDSYSSAPASVSMLLAGIITKTVGVYTLIRVVISVFGFTPAVRSLLLVVGAISVVAGALAALGQNDWPPSPFCWATSLGCISLTSSACWPIQASAIRDICC
ncbi:MAG: proton-conducting transporter membrane subunit [Candidatus Omnitrophica bacterium]|nr:proton-conducting transporter membrane subunit [Candidatus Omnitrophota bacterium]